MGTAFFDGWRGRIGLVATAPGNATEADFNRYRPEGVAVLTTRTPLLGSTVEGIRRMNDYVESAACMLAENAFCDVVLLSSTAGSFVNGPAHDRELSESLGRKTGKTVITSSASAVAALQTLGAGRITLITPSSGGLNEAEQAYLTACGIETRAVGSFGYSAPRDILSTDPREVYALTRRTVTPDSDAVFISCSGLHVMELLDTLERDTKKPVIASNQIGLWACLRALGIAEPIRGAGSLLCR